MIAYYSPETIVVYDAWITTYNNVREFVEMIDGDLSDVRPASYDEIIMYTKVNP
jgi:hypothetical protein